MRRSMTIAFLTTSLLLGGCGKEPPHTQTLFVDPVPVAKSVGRDELIQKQLNSAIEQLNAQLRRHRSDLSAQLEQEKGKLGKNPSDESTAKFEERVAAASQSVKQTQLLAQRKAADYRTTLLSEFNAELRDAAGEIARTRGATSVLIVDDSLLWFDPAADITADVIAKLRAKEVSKGKAISPADLTEKREIERLGEIVDSIEEQDRTAR